MSAASRVASGRPDQALHIDTPLTATYHITPRTFSAHVPYRSDRSPYAIESCNVLAILRLTHLLTASAFQHHQGLSLRRRIWKVVAGLQSTRGHGAWVFASGLHLFFDAQRSDEGNLILLPVEMGPGSEAGTRWETTQGLDDGVVI